MERQATVPSNHGLLHDNPITITNNDKYYSFRDYTFNNSIKSTGHYCYNDFSNYYKKSNNYYCSKDYRSLAAGWHDQCYKHNTFNNNIAKSNNHYCSNHHSAANDNNDFSNYYTKCNNKQCTSATTSTAASTITTLTTSQTDTTTSQTTTEPPAGTVNVTNTTLSWNNNGTTSTEPSTTTTLTTSQNSTGPQTSPRASMINVTSTTTPSTTTSPNPTTTTVATTTEQPTTTNITKSINYLINCYCSSTNYNTRNNTITSYYTGANYHKDSSNYNNTFSNNSNNTITNYYFAANNNNKCPINTYYNNHSTYRHHEHRHNSITNYHSSTSNHKYPYHNYFNYNSIYRSSFTNRRLPYSSLPNSESRIQADIPPDFPKMHCDQILLNRGYRRIYPLTFLRCIVIRFWPGSVGVDTQLIFRNQTVVPNITDTTDSLRQAINESTVFLNIIPSSITAEERNLTSATSSPQMTTTAAPTTVSATTASSSASATTASSSARTRPEGVVTFLLPLILIYFMMTEQRLLWN
ncbi:myb-like protein M [Chanos chanos]|uniref:Myb-like protein M n=1 Tax=Chanos chanos TaxID=29144 RepID=A0A6J2WE15_CHACN|nr:myb-like protein M [Chanos chanos]